MSLIGTPLTDVVEGGPLGGSPMTDHKPPGPVCGAISDLNRCKHTTSRGPQVSSAELSWVAQAQAAQGSPVTAFHNATAPGPIAQLIRHGKDWPHNGHEFGADGVVDRKTGQAAPGSRPGITRAKAGAVMVSARSRLRMTQLSRERRSAGRTPRSRARSPYWPPPQTVRADRCRNVSGS